MDEKAKSSFIPKKPIVKSGYRGSSDPTKSLFYRISLAVFLLCLFVSAGAYGYKLFLSSQIEGMKDELSAATEKLDNPEIDEYGLLDQRLKLAEEVVSEHHTVTPIFDLLSELTLSAVQFTSFSFAFESNTDSESPALGFEGAEPFDEPAVDDATAFEEAAPMPEAPTAPPPLSASSTTTVEIEGLADSFETVALQAREFEAAEFIESFDLSNLALSEEGQVTFSIAADIDPELISYISGFADSEELTEGEEEEVDGDETEPATEEDGPDGVMQAELIQVQVQAEAAYENADSYAGVCESEYMSNTFLVATEEGGEAGDEAETYCGVSEDGSQWATWVTLPSDSSAAFCVDSVGVAVNIEVPQSDIVECPQI